MKKPIRTLKILLYVCFTGLISMPLTGNESVKLIQRIDSLGRIVYSDLPDSLRMQANLSIHQELYQFLHTEASISFPYDSLRFIKTLSPGDCSFRLLTWVLPLRQHQYLYFGFIQLLSKHHPPSVIVLEDNQGNRNPEVTYPPDQWPGSVYYYLIEHGRGKRKFYTLFGWVGTRHGVASRIIETLQISRDGSVWFGLPVFNYVTGVKYSRVIFEFTERIPFHLAYEEHLLPNRKRKKAWMIIHNRLVSQYSDLPIPPGINVPLYDTFDGFVFRRGYWHPIEDIDARVRVRPTPPPARRDLLPEKPW